PSVGAAMIDEDMALGIRGDTNGFAESFAGRNLQEVRHRRVRDFGNILRRRLLLRERRNGTQHQSNGGYEKALHWGLPGNSRQYIKPGPVSLSVSPGFQHDVLRHGRPELQL